MHRRASTSGDAPQLAAIGRERQRIAGKFMPNTKLTVCGKPAFRKWGVAKVRKLPMYGLGKGM